MKRCPPADLEHHAGTKRQSSARGKDDGLPISPRPPPAMDALHAPVHRAWGRTEWEKWAKEEHSFWVMRLCGSESDSEMEEDADSAGDWTTRNRKQYCSVLNWAAPHEVAVRITRLMAAPSEDEDECDGEIAVIAEKVTVRRDSEQTMRSVIDKACASAGLERASFTWRVVHPRDEHHDKKKDLFWQRDMPCFNCLWEPGHPELWLNEKSYGIRMVLATPKTRPSPPTVQPSFETLKRPPPEATASAEEWQEWRKEHSCMTSHQVRARPAAYEWRCPARLKLRVEGLWHSHDAELGADDTLEAAAAAFCAAAPREALPLTPDDILLEQVDSAGRYFDQQTTSVRRFYRGTGVDRPLTFRVVHRDESREKADRKAKFGAPPPGYKGLGGNAYLLDSNEAPWYVSVEVGLELHNQVVREVRCVLSSSPASPIPFPHTFDCDVVCASVPPCGHASGTCSVVPITLCYAMLCYALFVLRAGDVLPQWFLPQLMQAFHVFEEYDLKSWDLMAKRLKKILSGIVLTPRGGHSAGSALVALDKLTAFFLVTARCEEWKSDYKGRSWLMTPGSSKLITDILRQMSEGAAKIAAAAKEVAAEDVPARPFGVQRALDQLRRLLPKLAEEHKDIATGRGSSAPFVRAMALLEEE